MQSTRFLAADSLYFSNTCAKYVLPGCKFVVFLEHVCKMYSATNAAVGRLCCGCSPAHFDADQHKVGWLTGLLAGHLFKIQKNVFLHWSNAFLTILSLRELQFDVILINFHLFSLPKSIFTKISFSPKLTASCLIQIDLKLIFLNIDLSTENKRKLINLTPH